MGLKPTDAFRQDALRIALTSGLTRKQVADDLGVGMSTLNKWITSHRDTNVVSKGDLSLAQGNDRLRRENRILKEQREILNKATQFSGSHRQRSELVTLAHIKEQSRFCDAARVRPHNRNMTFAARAIVERKTFGHLSQRVATRRQSLILPHNLSIRFRRL